MPVDKFGGALRSSSSSSDPHGLVRKVESAVGLRLTEDGLNVDVCGKLLRNVKNPEHDSDAVTREHSDNIAKNIITLLQNESLKLKDTISTLDSKLEAAVLHISQKITEIKKDFSKVEHDTEILRSSFEQMLFDINAWKKANTGRN